MNGIEMVLSYVIVLGIGAMVGHFFASARYRRDGDGKTVQEWRAEYSEYKESVNEHFQRSAELFQGLTEQYRQVYSHLAEGAVTLCKDSNDDPAIEALRTGLLTGGVAGSAGTVEDPATVSAEAAEAVSASSADFEEPAAAETAAEPSDLADVEASAADTGADVAAEQDAGDSDEQEPVTEEAATETGAGEATAEADEAEDAVEAGDAGDAGEAGDETAEAEIPSVAAVGSDETPDPERQPGDDAKATEDGAETRSAA